MNAEYQLLSTHLRRKFYISTAYRQSSSIELGEMWYFETITWEWNEETKQRGRIIDQEDSGADEISAIQNHNRIVLELLIESKP